MKNMFYNDSPNKAEKINNLFRTKNYNILDLTLQLFEPFYTTNDNLIQFGTPIFEFMASISDTPLFRSVMRSSKNAYDQFKKLYSVANDHFPQMKRYLEIIVGQGGDKGKTPGTDGHAGRKKSIEAIVRDNELLARKKDEADILVNNKNNKGDVDPELRKLRSRVDTEEAQRSDQLRQQVRDYKAANDLIINKELEGGRTDQVSKDKALKLQKDKLAVALIITIRKISKKTERRDLKP